VRVTCTLLQPSTLTIELPAATSGQTDKCVNLTSSTRVTPASSGSSDWHRPLGMRTHTRPMVARALEGFIKIGNP